MKPEQTFFFYDLETSGLDPKRQRIMQFAGQRTDMDLKPIGEPVNIVVKLTDEVLPNPLAIAVTGITPQQTAREGISEAELARQLQTEVFTPGTIVAGFNSVRFDDEFIRYTMYRNFYDPYEWCWADGRSRWDLLDVVRMTRALRPDGITWPFHEDGRAINTLGKLAAANGVVHTKAHDAMSDVEALIAVCQLLRDKQPKLFDYLLEHRGKSEVAEIAGQPRPFIYTSGRYPSAQLHTTVAASLGDGSRPGSLIVYDLHYDPADYADMSVDELKALRFAKKEAREAPGFKPFPAKELITNRCPTVAPLNVLDAASEERIGLTGADAIHHLAVLRESDLATKLGDVFKRGESFPKAADVDGALYDGFMGNFDKPECAKVTAAEPTDLATLKPAFRDARLPELFMRYKARNYPDALSDEEETAWEAYRSERIMTDMPDFAKQLEQIGASTDPRIQSLANDLKLWAETIIPAE